MKKAKSSLVEKLVSNNWYVFVFLTFFSLLFWWPSRNLPYHWDTADFVINAARNLQQTGFIPLVAEHSEFAHPPLFPAMIALVWNLFGETKFITHLITFPFLPLLLYGVFLVGKKITDSVSALGACLIVATTPLILAEYGQVYLDIPSAALVALAIAAWFEGKYFWTGVVLSLAGLIKLPTLVIVAPLVFFTYKKISFDRSNYKEYGWLMLPMLVAAGWLYYHFLVTGWWLHRPGRMSAVVGNVWDFLTSLKFVIYALFIHNGRWVPGLLGGFALIRLVMANKLDFAKRINFQLLFGLIFIGLVFFAYIGEFAPRYGIFVFPFYVLLSLFLFSKMFSRNQVKIGIVGAVLVNMYYWNPTPPPDNHWQIRHSEDLSYRNIIAAYQDAALFLENSGFSGKVYGGFAENYQLTQPYQGYVTEPMDFTFCSDVQEELEQGSVIYLSAFHYTLMYCRDLVAENEAELLRVFDREGYKVRLYLVGDGQR